LLIWDVILLNRYWVRNGAFVAIFLIVILLCAATGAYAGFEPLSNVKDKVSAWVSNVNNSTTKSNEVTPQPTTSPKQIILKQYFLAGYFIAPKVIELNEVQRWLYSSSKQLTFRSINPPYVVNAAIRTQTSQVATSLEVRVYRRDDPYKTSDIPITTRSIPRMGGVQAFIIQAKGDYVIDVKSVGCEWWVMVGHESEAYRQ